MIILVWSSPDRVEIWEGVLTFLFFPLLVGTAWAVDVGWCFDKNREASGHIVYAEEMGLTRAVTMDMLAKKRKEVKEEFRKTLPEETLMKLSSTRWSGTSTSPGRTTGLRPRAASPAGRRS